MLTTVQPRAASSRRRPAVSPSGACVLAVKWCGPSTCDAAHVRVHAISEYELIGWSFGFNERETSRLSAARLSMTKDLIG